MYTALADTLHEVARSALKSRTTRDTNVIQGAAFLSRISPRMQGARTGNKLIGTDDAGSTGAVCTRALSPPRNAC